MTVSIAVEEAQLRLKELIDRLAPGEEIVLTENGLPAARLVCERPALPPQSPRPAPGLGKGSILYMAPDFDDTPAEFVRYIK